MSFISRSTIHALLRLSIAKHVNVNKPTSIIDIWLEIQFIIIEKISIVGCTLLVTMHLKLQILKSNILSFGGINIMFSGDFSQFSLINDKSLYSTTIQLIFAFTSSIQKKVIGKSLWENYIWFKSIVFIEQMQQNKDIQYVKLLENLGIFKKLKLDFDLLKTCFLSNSNLNLFDDSWKATTFIVPRNELWNAINHYMIDIHLKTLKQKCYVIIATNTYKMGPIRKDIKYIIK